MAGILAEVGKRLALERLSPGDLRRRRHVAMSRRHIVTRRCAIADQVISAPSARPEREGRPTVQQRDVVSDVPFLIMIAASVIYCAYPGGGVPISDQPLLA
jgi:hypothetical protein